MQKIIYFSVQNSYNKIGKYGLAIVGNNEQTIFEIIIYKDNQNIILRVKLTANSKVIMQDNVFATIVDDKKQYWSTRFTSSEDLQGFVSALEARKFKVIKPTTENNETVSKKTDIPDKTADKISFSGGDEPKSGNLSNEDAETKANILSRIVKMGQQAFPMPQNESTNVEEPVKSESLLLEVDLNKESKVPTTITKTNFHNQLPQSPTENLVNIAHEVMPVSSNFNNYSNNEMLSMQCNMQAFFSEHRMHNAETRMNLCQMSSKLDSVMKDFQSLKSVEHEILKNKVDMLEAKLSSLSKADSQNETSVFKALETKIDELIDVNKNLRTEIEKLQKDVKEKDCCATNNDTKLPNKFQELIKMCINDMYQNMCQNFADKETYTNVEIGKELAKCIKDETLKLMQKLEENYV